MQSDRIRLRHSIWLRGVKAANVLMVTLPLALAWLWYYNLQLPHPYFWRGQAFVVGLYMVAYAWLLIVYGGITISLYRISELIYSQFLAYMISDAMFYALFMLLARKWLSIWPLLLTIVAQGGLSVLWCESVHFRYFKKNRPLRSVVIWDMRQGLDELIASSGLDQRFNVLDTPHVDAVIADLSLLDQAQAVFLCGIHSKQRNIIIKYCVAHGIRAYIIPRIGDVIMAKARPIHMFYLPMLQLDRYNPRPEYVFIKRAFDIFASGLALILLSPLMGVVALLIRRDGGTALYRQKRLTKDGRVFELLKFRSMRMDAESDGVARLSSGENDDRITPVGRVFRSLRMDELPQLWNILKGDMSVVGPRPERPEIAAEYEKEMPEFGLRLQCKAGLTGYAQVFGKYNSTPYDKLLMDLRYIAQASVTEDIRIILGTIKILFLPESTEGVAVGATTAMDYENAADSTENDAETVRK